MAYTKQKQELMRQYGCRCMLCQRVLNRKTMTAHHRHPRACGGTSDLSNMTILCMSCQIIIHKFKYGSEAYATLDKTIERNMDKYKRQKPKRE